MAGFEEVWTAISRSHHRECVSPELKPLLQRVYEEFQSTSIDASSLIESLLALLHYLCGIGRTNANCWAVDSFFSLDNIGWEKGWTDHELPDDLHDVLADMGGALHDTVSSPEIARNFDSLPEQLLDRIRRLKGSSPGQ